MSSKDEKNRAPLLIDEPPMLVYPSLAVAMGINKAVVFQQLHFLLNGQKTAKNKYNHVDGHWWVYNSYQEWKDTYFPWLSVSSLKGIFLELEKEKLVIARQSVKSKSDRKKWYTIDYKQWDKKCLMMGQKLSHVSSDKNCPIDEPENVPSTNGENLSDGYSETSKTSTETSEQREENAPAPDVTPALSVLPEAVAATAGLRIVKPIQEAQPDITPLKELPKAAGAEPPSPVPAHPSPLPAHIRNFETGMKPLHPLLEAWRGTHSGIKPTIPITQLDSYDQAAIALSVAGVTVDHMRDFVQYRIDNGLKTGWTFIVADIHDYLNGKNKPPKQSKPAPTPEPIAPIKPIPAGAFRPALPKVSGDDNGNAN